MRINKLDEEKLNEAQRNCVLERTRKALKLIKVGFYNCP